MPKTEKIRYDKLRHLATLLAVGPRLFPPTRACLECVLQRNRCDIADPRPSRVLADPYQCCLSTTYFVAPRSRVAMVCSFSGTGRRRTSSARTIYCGTNARVAPLYLRRFYIQNVRGVKEGQMRKWRENQKISILYFCAPRARVPCELGFQHGVTVKLEVEGDFSHSRMAYSQLMVYTSPSWRYIVSVLSH